MTLQNFTLWLSIATLFIAATIWLWVELQHSRSSKLMCIYVPDKICSFRVDFHLILMRTVRFLSISILAMMYFPICYYEHVVHFSSVMFWYLPILVLLICNLTIGLFWTKWYKTVNGR